MNRTILNCAWTACLLLGLVLMAHTVSAAGKAKPSSHQSASARCKKRVTPRGTLIFSDWQFPDNLNPYQTTSATSFAILNFVQDSLVYWDQNAQLQPEMLSTLPTQQNGGISTDGKTVVLTLKPGLRWSNGTPLTAQDIKFSWQIADDPATGICPAIGCDLFQSIATRGADTAVIHLKQPYAAVVSSAITFPIMPRSWPHAWTNNAHAAARKLESPRYTFEGRNYPSSGAYQVTKFASGDRIVLKPMPYYDDMTCGAAIKTAVFTYYSSKAGMIAAAQAKQTDLTGFGGGYSAVDLPQLSKHAGAYKLVQRVGLNYEFLEMNHDARYNGKPNPLANANVRVALALAIDKLGLIRSALGVSAGEARSVEAWTPWVNTPSFVQPYADTAVNGQWDPVRHKYVQTGTSQAIADAGTLLSRTPWKKGFTVALYTTQGTDVRQAQVGILAQDWQKIGVRISPNYVPSAKLFAAWGQGGILAHGAFQVAMHGFATTPEPDSNKTLFQSRFIDRRQRVHSEANQNYSGIADPVLDRAFNAAASSFSPAVRRANYYTAQVEIDRQAHWIMLYFKPVIITYSPKLWPVYDNPTSCQVTCNAWDWRLNS